MSQSARVHVLISPEDAERFDAYCRAEGVQEIDFYCAADPRTLGSGRLPGTAGHVQAFELRSKAVNPYSLKRSSRQSRNQRPSAVDLFSGAGGISLGLINAGFDVVYCSDRDEACARTHRRNFPGIPFVQEDIEHLKGADILRTTGLKQGELDLLIGGPPCQGFSIIGQREIWDPRNGLFHEFLRIAEELKPKCIVIENVTGLANTRKRERSLQNW